MMTIFMRKILITLVITREPAWPVVNSGNLRHCNGKRGSR